MNRLIFLLLTFLSVAVVASEETLVVVDVIPSYLSNEYLSGQTAITIIFNRPVIALGSDWLASEDDSILNPAWFVDSSNQVVDIPGKFRWVSTWTVRFDPDYSWGSDLQISLVVNPQLMTYDGIPLDVKSVPTRIYKTPSLTFYVMDVVSPLALQFTDGHWNAFLSARDRSGGWKKNAPEIPYDSTISLQFSSQVEMELIRKNLQLISENKSESPISIKVNSCYNETDTESQFSDCVLVNLKEGSKLEIDKYYYFHIPKGSTYSSLSGPSRSDINTIVSGLHGFIFPYTDYLTPSHHNYDLYLRHGLSHITQLSSLKESISFSPSIDFTLTIISADRLRISSPDLKSNQKYVLTVLANQKVVDGFNLTLQSHQFDFTTANQPVYQSKPSSPYYSSPEIVYYDSMSWSSNTSYDFLSQGSTSCSRDLVGKVLVTKVNSNNIGTILPTVVNNNGRNTIPYDIEVKLPVSQSCQVTGFEMERLLNKMNQSSNVFSGLLMMRLQSYSGSQSNCYIYDTFSFVNLSPFKGHFVSVGNNQIIGFITYTNSGLPVSGANVTFISFNYGSSAPSYKSAITGRDGTVIVSLSSRDSNYFALVEYQNGQHFALVPSPFSVNSLDYQSTFITDRSLYRVGETIYLKGYLEYYEKQNSNPKISVGVMWKDSLVKQSLNYNSDFGSIEGELVIPSDSLYGNHYLNFYDSDKSINTIQIMIADPKIPTSILTMETDKTFYRTSYTSLPLRISTTTYTGIGISGSTVNLIWRLKRARSTSSNGMFSGIELFNSFARSRGDQYSESVTGQVFYDDESGLIEVGETDENGQVSRNVTFPFKNPPVEGDTLVLEAQWVGPSRELLTESISLKVEASDINVVIQLTERGDLFPGLEFGVFVDTQDVVSQKSLTGMPVEIELRGWDGVQGVIIDQQTGKINNPNSFPVIGGVGGQPVRCRVTSDGGNLPKCRLNLPNLGEYVVVAISEDREGFSVTTMVKVGRTQESWNDKPLREFKGITVKRDQMNKNEFSLNDVVSFNFFNPYRASTTSTVSASSSSVSTGTVMVVRGNGNNLVTSFYSLSSLPLSSSTDVDTETISLTLGRECLPSCQISLVFVWGHNAFTSSHLIPSGVRISPLFDWRAPRSMDVSFFLNVVDNSIPTLSLTLSPKSTIVSPGQKTKLTVSLEMDNKPTSGEVCVMIVDKSFIDIFPHPLTNTSETMIPPNPYVSYSLLSPTFSTERVLRDSLEIYLARLRENVWVTPNWNILPDPPGYYYYYYLQEYLNDVELTYQQFSDRYYYQLTNFPYYPSRDYNKEFGAGAPSASPGDAGGFDDAESIDSGNGDSQSSDSPSSMRSEIIPTPVFVGRLLVDESGVAEIKYKLPDNLSTFSIYVYGVSKSKTTTGSNKNVYSSGETEIISRKTVNLQEISPRVVRNEDIFQAGVSVAALSSEFQGEVEVRVQMDCSEEAPVLKSKSQENFQRIKLSPETNVIEVLFNWKATSIGETTLIYEVFDVNENNESPIDALEIKIQVEGQQESVYIASSMTIDSQDNSDWSEGLQIPKDVPGSGSLEIVASVGKQAYILSVSSGLLEPPYSSSASSPASAVQLISSLVPSSILTDLYSSSTQKEVKSMISHSKETFSLALSLLPSYTSRSVGLQYYPPSTTRGSTSNYIDIYLNCYAVYISNRSLYFDKISSSGLFSLWSKAIDSYWAQRLADLNKYKSSPSSYDYDALCWTYLAVGPRWNSPSTMFSLSSLVDNYRNLSLSGKAALGLFFLLNEIENSIEEQIAQDLENGIRIQGRTAYITNDDSGHVDQLTTSLSLEVLLLSQYTSIDSLLPYISNYLSDEGKTNMGLPYYRGLSTQVYGLYSLSTYETENGNHEAKVTLKVKSGKLKLMKAKFDIEKGNTEVKRKSYPFTVLKQTNDNEYKNIMFSVKKKDVGEVLVTFGMRFVPAEISKMGSDKGFSVEKVIQLYDTVSQEVIHGDISEAKIGQFVLVTVQLRTTDDVRNAQLVDLVCGALEPLDSSIFSDLDVSSATQDSNSCDGCYYPYYFNPFSYIELKPNKVSAFAPFLSAGTYSFSYLAMVSSSGEFVVPPASVYLVDQPEYMGLSGGGHYFVSEDVKKSNPSESKDWCFN